MGDRQSEGSGSAPPVSKPHRPATSRPQLTANSRHPGLDPGPTFPSVETEHLPERGCEEAEAFDAWLRHVEAGRIG